VVDRLESEPGDDIRILLSHRPDVVLGLRRDSRIDLVVAGHTHGGQIVVPGFGPPMTLSNVPRAVAAGGLHRINENAVYVSRGVGCERRQAPRVRFLCPPEVSLIALQSQSAAREQPVESPRAGRAVSDFFNVVAPDGADPWVWKEDGVYYLVATTGRDVTLTRARTLSGLGAGERRLVWTPPASGPASRNVWAPELHRIDGKWYVYVAADDGENANHRMYALENPSVDPFEGEFRLKGKLAPPGDDHWAIDGTVARVRDRLYFLWSGWEGTEDVRQDLYIAPMSDPWTVSGPRTAIARPELVWETRGAPPAVIEGPEVLVRGDAVFVVYSCSGSWTDDYALGLLYARSDADLLAPASWTKRRTPLFASSAKVVAPGHGSFTTSPDGAEDWLVYHAARYPGAGWARNLRMQGISRGADGAPILGVPADPDAPLPLPSGDPPRRRYEAEAFAPGVQTAGASGGRAVTLSDDGLRSISIDFTTEAAGPHTVVARFGAEPRGRGAASAALTVNDGSPIRLRLPRSGVGAGRWSSVAVVVPLRKGFNRLSLVPTHGAVVIDAVDVVPDGPER
jgi:GH43 family beta-xylosidase